MKNVYVITGLDLGWDCVVAIYNKDEVSYEDLVKLYPNDDNGYVIHEKTIDTAEDLQNDIKEREWDTQESS